ncbi:Hypothetical predicted protein [Cloeon dipterum]|uniref:ZP domain-containing protein n=1 Tax=Cloeon dipterum TaxID=197152 RepID=A0A8S1CZH4_9INSE|nr:Hypothetical predicted protein [Cloeon dipterum]
MKRCKLFVATCLLGVLLIKGSALADAPHDSASLPLEHRAVYGPPPPGAYGPPPPGLGSLNTVGDDPWPLSAPDMPQIKHLQVQCEKTHMRVNIEFDRPFYGMIFSKGFYSDPHCVHLKPGTGHLSATFEIFLNSCGMTSSANAGGGGGGNGVVPHGAYGAPPTPSGSYVENTIIIQYDPYVQEVWDQARKLRCTWYDFYEKAVTFRPFQVDMLHAVTANFLGDNLQCWMQIQVGKGPWASEVSGIVKIGQTMTMVLAIKDDENKFDMLVRNCVAHDGKRAPIQLVDQYGCVVRPKIMSRFQKIKNFGPSASVVSFAYFQAFKFPDSMNVHFQCVIQVCRYNCPEPKCAGGLPGGDFPALGGPGPAEYGVPAGPGGPGLGGDYGVPVAAVGPEYGLANFGLDPPRRRRRLLGAQAGGGARRRRRSTTRTRPRPPPRRSSSPSRTGTPTPSSPTTSTATTSTTTTTTACVPLRLRRPGGPCTARSVARATSSRRTSAAAGPGPSCPPSCTACVAAATPSTSSSSRGSTSARRRR